MMNPSSVEEGQTMILYTVDSLNQLSQGVLIKLERHHDVKPKILQGHVIIYFRMASPVMVNFIFCGSSNPIVSNPQIELFFEYVRRACYPDRPSRFQSFFGESP